jgi:arsenate reductase (thioredoxin)
MYNYIYKGFLLSKKVLILSTKNSSRSIIAEAILQKYLHSVDTYSGGLKPSSKLDAQCIKILQKEGLWDEKFHPKNFNTLDNIEFDLVIIICENVLNRCPTFTNNTKVIYLDYEPLEGKSFSLYEQTLKDIKMELLPIIRLEL